MYLKSTYDLPERKSHLTTADEGGVRQTEAAIQVGLVQTVETYVQ